MGGSGGPNGESSAAVQTDSNFHLAPLRRSGNELGRIDLAREAAARLGPLYIEPALRRVAHDDGREEIVQPRVMQVLVALIRAGGRIVSRDELQMSCWHGVVVGEDALNRVISRLRGLADGIGDGVFKLETITKVGYRLVADRYQAQAPAIPAPHVKSAILAASPAEPLLAVLAFDNLCGGDDMAWFSDGVSEEILHTVARGAELKVIGRGSSFQFRGANKAAAHVASVLKATHVLDGSVRRSGGRVRITADLIECASETTLWSDRLERELTDVFALQDEIAAAVAAVLKIQFARSLPAEAVDPAAYDFYLKARETSMALHNAGTRLAMIRLLEQATTLAPSFARAWAMLAAVRVERLRIDEAPEPHAVLSAEVVQASERALELDPSLGEAHQALILLKPFGAYLERETLQRRALSVAPNDSTVLTNAALLFAQVGRIREALRFAERANDLDPMYYWSASWRAALLDYADRHAESRLVRERCCELWPDSDYIAWHALVSASASEEWDWFDEMVKAARDRGMYDRLRGVIWYGRNLRDPNPRSLKAYLEQTRSGCRRKGTLPVENITILYRCGFGDELFDLVDEVSFAYMRDPELHSPNGTDLSVIFSLTHNDGLMRDPRFPRLCAKLGLCDYWVHTDRWPDCAEAGLLPYDFRAECRRLTA